MSFKESLKILFTSPQFIVPTLLFSLASFMYSSYEALFPLWAQIRRKYGGIEWDTNHIGMVFMISGSKIICILFFVCVCVCVCVCELLGVCNKSHTTKQNKNDTKKQKTKKNI